MKLTPTILALRVAGVLLLAVAGVRFLMNLFRSFHASEAAAPHAGFVVGFATDYITLSVGMAGVLACVLGFGAGRNRR